MTVLTTILPVFAAILAGRLLARWRGLGADAVAALNAYVVWLALPALLFGFVARADRATFVSRASSSSARARRSGRSRWRYWRAGGARPFPPGRSTR